MRLINQDDDVLAGVDVRWDAVKLVNHRDDESAIIRTEDVLKLLLAVRDTNGLDAIPFDLSDKLSMADPARSADLPGRGENPSNALLGPTIPLVTHCGLALAAKWKWNLPLFTTTRQ